MLAQCLQGRSYQQVKAAAKAIQWEVKIPTWNTLIDVLYTNSASKLGISFVLRNRKGWHDAATSSKHSAALEWRQQHEAEVQ